MSLGSAPAGAGQQGYVVRRLESMSEVEPELWDSLSGGGGLYTSHRYVGSIESVEPVPGCQVSIYAAMGDGEPIGLLPVWRGLPADAGRYDLLALVADAYPEARADDWVPFATFGTRMAYSNCVAVDPRLPMAEQRGVLHSLVSEALDGSRGAAWFPYMNTAGAGLALSAMPGSHAILTGADAVLTVPDGGFDGYLASLSSRRRTRVHREIRRFSEAGVTVDTCTLEEAWPVLSDMLAQRLRKYGGAPDVNELNRILREYGRIFGENALVLLGKIDGEPIAYVSVYPWRGELYGRSWGFLSDRRDAGLYFNLAYYQTIMVASQLGIKRIHYGMLAYEAKARRGAVLEPRWSVVRPAKDQTDEFAAAITRRNCAMSDHLGLDPSAPVPSPDAEKPARNGG